MSLVFPITVSHRYRPLKPAIEGDRKTEVVCQMMCKVITHVCNLQLRECGIWNLLMTFGYYLVTTTTTATTRTTTSTAGITKTISTATSQQQQQQQHL